MKLRAKDFLIFTYTDEENDHLLSKETSNSKKERFLTKLKL